MIARSCVQTNAQRRKGNPVSYAVVAVIKGVAYNEFAYVLDEAYVESPLRYIGYPRQVC